MNETRPPRALRRPLSISEIRDRIEERLRAGKDLRLTNETGWQVLFALRAYTAHPSHKEVIAVICQLRTMRTEPCQFACQRCSTHAADIRRLYRGEESPFKGNDWYPDKKAR